MAITQAMCTSFKKELLTATHNFATGGNAFKIALFTSSATMGATTTAYSTSQEVANSGSYAAGGGTLTKVAPASSGTTGFTDFADFSFTTATITARGALIYNDTASDKAIAVLAFGGDFTVAGGTFEIVLPAAGTSGIIRID